jgi:hypothetical protein
MKNVLVLIIGLISITSFATDYQVSDEKWSSKLLSETCPKQLKQAINYVQNKLKRNKEYVAIIPENIGYKYFNIEFKEVVNNIVFSKPSSNRIIHQFEYWSHDDAHTKCTRVESTDFIY